MRKRSLEFGVTWYLGTLTWDLPGFGLTGIPLMLYYHPSAPQAYADMKDLEFVVSDGRVPAQPASLVGACHGAAGVRASVQGFLSGSLPAAAGIQLGDRSGAPDPDHCSSAIPAILPWDQLSFWADYRGLESRCHGSGGGA